MKLHRRILALALAGWIACVSAAPDKVSRDDNTPATTAGDPIANYASPGDDAVGDMLLQAISLLGVAYRFGGSSPNTGLDCSGFIQYVFKKSLKVNLPRTSAEMARAGRAVSKSELMPGDLVFFNTRGFSYSHVGIYLGNGKFIHAPRTGKNIEVTALNQSYWLGRYNGARRVSRGAAVAGAEADSGQDAAGTGDSAGARVSAVCTKGRSCRATSGKKGKKTRRH
jgi:cell wall-associated NlpC family hydrolase